MGRNTGNRRLYIDILRAMSPEQRLGKAFELTAMARELTRTGLARRFPTRTASEIDALTRARVIACHNRTS